MQKLVEGEVGQEWATPPPPQKVTRRHEDGAGRVQEVSYVTISDGA